MEDEPLAEADIARICKTLRHKKPDFKVLVGGEEAVFEHYGEMLALRSEYFEALLANPMRESETRTVRLPDITPRFWYYMMLFLEPGVNGMTPAVIYNILPWYDKYRFKAGLDLCDLNIHTLFSHETAETSVEKLLPFLAELVIMFDLPNSKNLVMNRAEEMLLRQHLTLDLSPEEITIWASLIQDKQQWRLIASIAGAPSTSEGKVSDFSVWEDLIAKESFGWDYWKSVKYHYDHEQQYTCLYRAMDLEAHIAVTSPFGYSETFIRKNTHPFGWYTLNAFTHTWVRETPLDWNGEFMDCLVLATDPTGYSWAMVLLPQHWETNVSLKSDMKDVFSEAIFLFTWESADSKILPPREGWKPVLRQYPSNMVEISYDLQGF